MDFQTLKLKSRRLESILNRYAPGQTDLQACQHELRSLFVAIENGKLPAISSVPCARFFAEAGFSSWRDLENAYAEFYETIMDYLGLDQ